MCAIIASYNKYYNNYCYLRFLKLIKAPIYEELRKYLSDATTGQDLFLYVPYVQKDVLKQLLSNINNQVSLITTWKPLDLLLGSSELSVYEFCKERRFTLYINNNLHLKVYSRDLDDIILSTANISRRGLGTIPNYNHECAFFIPNLSNEDKIFFNKIIRESILIDDNKYNIMVKWIQNCNTEIPNAESFETIMPYFQRDQFLISALPMTRDVETLECCYLRMNSGESPSDNREIKNCVFHDLSNYQIDLGLNSTEFRKKLTTAFFSHPFIERIDEIINPEAYFGKIKEWIQKNCNDVPVPSRRELTGNVQVLLEWFQVLGNGRYIIDVPGSHSQRIRKLF